jgi:hypothetical protein
MNCQRISAQAVRSSPTDSPVAFSDTSDTRTVVEAAPHVAIAAALALHAWIGETSLLSKLSRDRTGVYGE